MTTNLKSELRVLKLSEIQISKTNPRKVFDGTAQAELTESIKEHGVLQPILVRPTKKGFELVCGERRYRSATAAGLESIPASIRELSDDEAFELQIIENLERKDVHPLEEAEAFKRMLDCGRYTLQDIAAKMAKPENFITQRLKLNDLIIDIKKDFYDGELGVGHAFEIARLDPEMQEGLLKFYKDRYGVKGYGTLKNLQQEISNHSMDLKKALFDLDIDFKHAKSCNGCASRSASNPQLFPEMEGKDTCFNKNCFQAKKTEHIDNKAIEIMMSGKDILLGKDSYNTPSDAIQKAATKFKTPILKEYTDYYTVQKPDYVKTKIFVTAGSEAGKTISVWVRKPRENDSPVDAGTASQIAKIEQKAERALELDAEKIHANIIAALKGNFVNNKVPEFKLEQDFIESMMLYMAMSDVGMYNVREDLKKLMYNLKLDYKTPEEMHADFSRLTAGQKKQIMVILMFKKFYGSQSDRYFEGKVIRKMALSNPEISVPEIEAEQKAAAEKRIKRTAERIAELTNDKPAGKPKKAKEHGSS